MKLLIFAGIFATLPLAAVEIVNADFSRFNAGTAAGWRENTGAVLPLAAVEIVNADFSRFNAGTAAGWRENTGAVELKAAPPKGITLKIRRANALDSSLEQLVRNPPKGVTLRFAATVEADQPKMAYLSVKLFRGGKEINRVNSPLNTSNKQ